MKVSEAIIELKDIKKQYSGGTEECEIIVNSIELAIQSLEMQDKLKQWIENYKNPEFKDVMITRDGLIDILEEFRLECETDERNTV